MQHLIRIDGLDDLERAAACFLKEIGEHRLIAFYAPMGAGKTTFTTALCKVLGLCSDAVSSPSFAIVNEYLSDQGHPIYHFDFYRLKDSSEALDIGFYDYLDSGEFCFIEWPEMVEELLPEETLRVRIAIADDSSRTLTWED